MANDIGIGLMTKPRAYDTRTLLLMYAGGPVLVTRVVSADPGVAIVNPLATLEPESQFTTTCDLSGFTVKAGDTMRRTWDNYYVLERFWELRHPQDFVRAKPEAVESKQGNPRPEDRFIGDDLPQVTPDDL